MNAAWVCLAGLITLSLGYVFYSRYIARHVFGLSDDEPVPAKQREDGIDYVPTPRGVLFGHHYSSIAGAAPIIGPAIAVIWGWLPAVIWVVLGSVFLGAVHDFAVLVLSVRHEGKSVGEISARVLGRRARPLFLLVIYFLVMLVIAVFAKAIAHLFVAHPGSVLPINFEIVVAVAVGYLCYRRRVGLLIPSIVALVTLYFMVWVGTKVPLSLAPLVGVEHQHTAWVVLLLAYSFVASILPVWLLLQPRDYVNSHQLFVGLGLLVLGIFVARPLITAPAVAVAPADAPAMIPFLFVTIACGAISGFHGLVSSGTTSKQIARATDCRAVGYGAMLGEGLLALIATLAVSAGLADFASHYGSFAQAAKGGVAAFVEGAASFLTPLGLARGPAEVLIAVIVISFAATSLDTGVRIQRYILHELGDVYQIRLLDKRWVAGLLSVFPALVLVLSGHEGSLWPLFGATNQLLAGLSLLVVTLWLVQSRRPWLQTGLPMLLVLALAGTSMAMNLADYYRQGNLLLLIVGGLISALLSWVLLEAIVSVARGRRATPAPSGGEPG